ncbi:MAG: ferrous iron transport protein B [Thermodesulfobacteriota bacterium]|nr:ferrous iron transport protein B [Thermodesulfobacteriota bacterium]
MEATIALAGNPNAGKTTLFNELTGARQHVGNYPGVTVEKREGFYKHDGYKFNVVDLPGTYSLTAYSLEEVVARDFLVNEAPAMVIDIVDATNLERNLYLTLQFLEMGVPVCIALNMMDMAKTRGIEIDIETLSKRMGISVIPTVARTGSGKTELLEAVTTGIQTPPPGKELHISYGADIDNALDEMARKITDAGFLTRYYAPRWTALKYLEKDEQIMALGRETSHELSRELEQDVEKVTHHLLDILDTYPEAMIADHRYGYINALLKQGVITRRQEENRIQVSDKIDRVVTNRFVGPIIMALVVIGLFQFTFTYSAAPVGWVEGFFGWLGGWAEAHVPGTLFKSLVVSGVIDGVGGVLGFVPLIMFMFFGIAILEDSGYLARVAYMLDRVFRAFGLHGSSVMAFIVSGGIAGGCAVPGVMAARTLKSPKERLATILTVPFMNCGAKLPVFALLTAAFFSKNEAMIMVIITLIAWSGALLVARLLRSTVIKGESTPFVMELPPYRLPTFKGLLIHTWERTWQYIKKAGTVILGISILLWAMMTFPGLPDSKSAAFEAERTSLLADAPAGAAAELETSADLSPRAKALRDRLMMIDGREAEAALRHSIAGRIGTGLESITQLAGFDWRTNIALVGGFAAKEVVVSTLGTAYSLGEVDPEEIGSLSDRLAASPDWTPLAAWSLILFTIFYAPCFVAVVCIAREAGSWKWGAFSMVFNTALAFALSVAMFQVGSLLGY